MYLHICMYTPQTPNPASPSVVDALTAQLDALQVVLQTPNPQASARNQVVVSLTCHAIFFAKSQSPMRAQVFKVNNRSHEHLL